MQDLRVSLVVLSCGRPDLLRRTLESFLKYNTYQIDQTVIHDDSGQYSRMIEVMEWTRKEFKAEWHFSGKRSGSVESLDNAYRCVRNDWVFMTEDDWDFLRPGFIEDSFKVMLPNKWVMSVQMTSPLERQYPAEGPVLDEDGVLFRRGELNFMGMWDGYTHNPGLRRHLLWKLHGPYAGLGWENHIGRKLSDAGYRSVILENPATTHTGNGRHITDPGSLKFWPNQSQFHQSNSDNSVPLEC